MNTLFTFLDVPQSQGGGLFQSLIMMLIIIVIFYFLMIRPQTQKAKKENAFRASLTPGTKVITAGGIHATVREVKDNFAYVEIAQGVKIKIALTSLYPSEDTGVANGEVSK